MESLSIRQARRLALARAGLLKPEWTGMPRRAAGRGKRARDAAHRVIRRFGYLQLDTVAVAGARSHAIVLLSRIEGMDPALGEELLRPGAPLFEYWGHEASWLPIELYPAFGFRRREYANRHPWWEDLLGEHPEVADELRRRIRDEGPLRSVDMEGSSGAGWWNLKTAKKVASALWLRGELAIRERRSFLRVYDLSSRVIPEELRGRPMNEEESLDLLLLKALDGHGWASTGTLAATWRLVNRRAEIAAALERLVEKGEVVPCVLRDPSRRDTGGWVRTRDLELAARLARVRPRRDRGLLLSPFDPLLWDRARVARLFDFDQVLEIFKPAAKRRYGYYCLPVLAGERLVARFDLKADRRRGRLRVISRRLEDDVGSGTGRVAARAAARAALDRFAAALRLRPVG